MKMVLIICPETRIEEVRELLDEHHLEGYTELSDVRGSGTTGKRLGTRAYPGSSCMVFVVVEASKLSAAGAPGPRACAPWCFPWRS